MANKTKNKYLVQNLRKRFLHPGKSNQQILVGILGEITTDVFEEEMLRAEIGFILENLSEAVGGLNSF